MPLSPMAAGDPENAARAGRVRPAPHVLLVDLNLPKKDGRQVLAEIKAVKSYQLQANVHLTKPVRLEKFETLVRRITDFWLIAATLPEKIRLR